MENFTKEELLQIAEILGEKASKMNSDWESETAVHKMNILSWKMKRLAETK